MAWTAAVSNDLEEFARRIPSKVSSLGDPIVNAQVWHELIVAHPVEWKLLVQAAFAGYQCEVSHASTVAPAAQSSAALENGSSARIAALCS